MCYILVIRNKLDLKDIMLQVLPDFTIESDEWKALVCFATNQSMFDFDFDFIDRLYSNFQYLDNESDDDFNERFYNGFTMSFDGEINIKHGKSVVQSYDVSVDEDTIKTIEKLVEWISDTKAEYYNASFVYKVQNGNVDISMEDQKFNCHLNGIDDSIIEENIEYLLG